MLRYKKSEELLNRALKSIPLGTQTFSKSKTQYPEGASPFYIEKGAGSHVWDVDGNEYIDFVSGLGAVILGYCDHDVDTAVNEQLKKGAIFSLPSSVEIDVAEKIIEMVPCAEMVRFGKNGADSTTAAIRLARAYTKKDCVLVGGYHGWHDWYIGSTSRNLGVPQSTRDLTYKFTFNDIESLKKVIETKPNDFAAIIFEPMGVEKPKKGFLEEVRAIANQYKIVLIFDEVVTGFRCANGGAQEYFGVIPDLAAIGKGIANGYPLSAVVGKAEMMKLAEEIFFSFTFGSEVISLAAANATLEKIKNKNVTSVLIERGGKLIHEVQKLISKHSLENILSIGGYESSSMLIFKDTMSYKNWELKTLFLQETLRRGILTLGAHIMNYAHSEEDVKTLLSVYDQVFQVLKFADDNKKLHTLLQCKPLEPLFKIRNV
ncbi:MAG: hypothetical protein ACD_45C00017G0001 [uncultured bacterium]|nr:MAG: hypothetical protein ACD_45C00017G0001 [uncultured bacterium]HLB43600.1 aminotransferase class III-fold pyridoxal phosphate-dependent enzyme [Gammaproteobacteria bacterium]